MSGRRAAAAASVVAAPCGPVVVGVDDRRRRRRWRAPWSAHGARSDGVVPAARRRLRWWRWSPAGSVVVVDVVGTTGGSVMSGGGSRGRRRRRRRRGAVVVVISSRKSTAASGEQSPAHSDRSTPARRNTVACWSRSMAMAPSAPTNHSRPPSANSWNGPVDAVDRLERVAVDGEGDVVGRRPDVTEPHGERPHVVRAPRRRRRGRRRA